MIIKISKEKKGVKIIFVQKDSRSKKISFLSKGIGNISEIKEYLKLYNFEANKNQSILFNINKKKYLVFSIEKNYSLDTLRKSASKIFKELKKNKEKEAHLIIPNEKEEEIIAIIEGANLSDYKFDKYISKKEKDINLNITLDISKNFEKTIKDTITICNNVKETRDLVNENANLITPIYLEKISKKLAKDKKLKIKVLNEKNLKKENLGLIEAVSKGSPKTPARLIIVEYKGDPKSKEKIALVGKGLTFDTGGLNLKPTNYIEDMKIDMAGAATVYGIFKSAVELKLKKNLFLVIPSTENAISESSYKPGDVIKSYSGKTVEITNTDAEGRLILADALSYIQKKEKPTLIIDFATLTGASMVALGMETAAVFGNDNNTYKKLKKISKENGEKIWKMPIFKDHENVLKSNIADTLNAAIGKGRFGGASSAAAFLKGFIEKDVKWLHFDIAGPAYSSSENSYIPINGTGRYVRLIVEYLKNN
jgi:leucyl aminopeptidase